MRDFAKNRENMIKGQLLARGVDNSAIVESFSVLPRELFVLEKVREIAYLDKTIALGQGRYLIDPCTYALLLQKAMPQPDDVVLDIGSASGYSSAVLSPLVTTVIALEHNKRQMDKAARLWNKMDLCNIAQIEKENLGAGHAKGAPYNLIIINGSIESIPDALLEQLSPGGRLACFLRKRNAPAGHAVLYYKSQNCSVSSQELFSATIPFLEECR